MTVVVGFYDRLEDARNAVQALVDSGFGREDISLVAGDAQGEYQRYVPTETGETVAEGAAVGAGIGAVVGGIGGLLVGLGALAIPGIGPVLAAGPLLGALGGASVGAATGGLLGALVGLGIPQEQAEVYEQGIRRGGTLVTVSTPEARADEAVAILDRYNAVDIDQRAAAWDSGKHAAHEGGVRVRSYIHRTDTDFQRYDPTFRSHYQSMYGYTGRDYEDYQPAYAYGYTVANDPRYRGRDWSEIEMDVRRDWERSYPKNAWEDFKDAVRHAWDTLTDGR